MAVVQSACGPAIHLAGPREVEARLVGRALAGKSDAFADLVQPHLGFLNRFARMRLASDCEAEDIVQQAVLKAFSHLRQFRGEASFKTWLGAIALHEVIHLRRGKELVRLRPLHDVSPAKLMDPGNSPYRLLQRRQEIDLLHGALIRLPEKYRQMIELRDLNELSIAETARALSLTTGAVKTRHHRARKLLLHSLTETRACGHARLVRRRNL